MNQPTSARSYRGEEENLGLTVRRKEVMEYIATHPHCTQNEAERDLGSGASQRSYGSRFVDLVAMGMIRQSGTKLDPVTGRFCLTYERTGRSVPLPLERESIVSENKAMLRAYEDAILAEERMRFQEMHDRGVQESAMRQVKQELRQRILRRMNRLTPPREELVPREVDPDALDELTDGV
jgi:hypothetical protein